MAITKFISIFLILNIINAINALNGASEPSFDEIFAYKCDQIHNENDQPFNFSFTTNDDALKIQVSGRDTHQIVSRIFAIILKQVIGYKKIKLVPFIDTANTDFYEPFSHISIDTVLSMHINMSINLEARYLPETHHSVDHVREIGSITSPGHFSLSVPTKYLDASVKQTHLWYTIFQKGSNYLNKFSATTEILEYLHAISEKYFMGKVCKRPTECAVIVADTHEETNFIEKYINFFKLKLQVFWLGKNKQITSKFSEEMKKLLERNEIFFVLHWSPSYIIDGPVNMTHINMPRCDQFRQQSRENLKCYFESIAMTKISSEFFKLVPIAYNFLEEFKFSSTQYLDLIQMLEQADSYDEVACRWLGENFDFYEKWLPKHFQSFDHPSDNPFLVPIGVMVPKDYDAINVAIHMAHKDIQDSRLLERYGINFYTDDDDNGNMAGRTLRLAHSFVDTHHVKAIIGPSTSSKLQSTTEIAQYENITVITYISGIGFQPENQHVFRTIGDNTQYGDALTSFMKKHKWSRLAIMTETGSTYTKYISDMITNYKEFVFERFSFPKSSLNDIQQRLETMKEKGYRIVYVDVSPETFGSIMCLAHDLEMSFSNEYVWITPLYLYELFSNKTNICSERNCTLPKFSSMLNGTFSIGPTIFDADLAKTNTNVSTRIEHLKLNIKESSPYYNYAGFAYDAVWIFALALRQIEQQEPWLLAPVGPPKINLRLIEIIRENIDFNGVTGRLKFDETGARNTSLSLMQWIDGRYKPIGMYKDGISLCHEENKDCITWSMHAKVPHDQPKCFLNIPCEHQALILGLLVTCTTSVVLLVVSFLYWKYMYEMKYKKVIDEYNLISWEISPSDISTIKPIGSGHFSKVNLAFYKTQNTDARYVAVKELNRDCTQHLREFFYEAEILKHLEHPNIIRLEGIFFDNGKMHMVLEYLKEGNLHKFLRSKLNLVFDNYYHNDISSRQLTAYARDIANALVYLHSKYIVHCDIAARNVLLTKDRQAKLSDFGLSIDASRRSNYRPRDSSALPAIPVRFTAPEVLRNREFSFKSDIWSFGIFLYEITSFGCMPYRHIYDDQIVINHIKNGNPLELPQGIPLDLSALIIKCLQYNANERCTAIDILHTLDAHPELIRPCVDMPSIINLSDITDNASDYYRHPPTMSYLALTNSNGYSDMRGSETQTRIMDAGGYTPINSILQNYHSSNSSTSPLLQSEYLQMNAVRNRPSESENSNEFDDNHI